ncbi:hypothetical protein TIFTF001_015846 [Ficus carica]|uniref:Amine oxidase n=1 Tax=Ficus carica TaxID=3494 RepID=A0AA88AMB0_FICCA|nr:hypothetical protein TIFTF001_015846 [Ficus carica]
MRYTALGKFSYGHTCGKNKSLSLPIFFIFIFISSISCHQKYHPLDPLTPSDRVQPHQNNKAYSTSNNHNITFQYVGLDGPEKSTILSWQSNPAPATLQPRRALVHARLDKQTLEITVDLSTRSIFSENKHQGTGFPMLTSNEQTVANTLVRKYGPLIESVKKRGLDMSQVYCSSFTVGRLRVPLPKAEGTEFRASKLRPPFGPWLNGVAMASNGPGFKVDGQVIR